MTATLRLLATCVFIIATQLLRTEIFNISIQFTNAPHAFPAVFEPRSIRRAEVVRREWEECEKDLIALLPAAKR